MAWKVLGLSGSPRKDGNTDDAVREVLQALAEEPAVTTEFLRVADYHIEPCIGCRECMRLEDCAQQDDEFHLLWRKLVQSDLLLLGAPVYWNAPPGIMKDFIDRSHAYYAAPEKAQLRGKQAAILSVATGGGFEPHESVMRSWLRYYGVDIVEQVRLYACEKGELLQRPSEVQKLRDLAVRLRNRHYG